MENVDIFLKDDDGDIFNLDQRFGDIIESAVQARDPEESHGDAVALVTEV